MHRTFKGLVLALAVGAVWARAESTTAAGRASGLGGATAGLGIESEGAAWAAVSGAEVSRKT